MGLICQFTGQSCDNKHHTERLFSHIPNDPFPSSMFKKSLMLHFGVKFKMLSVYLANLRITAYCLWQSSAENLNNLHKFTELVKGESRIQTQVVRSLSHRATGFASSIQEGLCLFPRGHSVLGSYFSRVQIEGNTIPTMMFFLPQLPESSFGLHTTLPPPDSTLWA